MKADGFPWKDSITRNISEIKKNCVNFRNRVTQMSLSEEEEHTGTKRCKKEEERCQVM